MVKLKKIKASTLVEAIVAMVIISITLGVMFGILNGINFNFTPQLKLKAFTLAQQSLSNHGETDENMREENGLYLEKTVSALSGSDNLKIIHIKVYSHTDKLLVEVKQLTTEQP